MRVGWCLALVGGCVMGALSSCGGGDSVDEQANMDQVLALADQGPDAVAQAIGDLPSPEARMIALLAYARAHPDQLTALCPKLPQGALRFECNRRQGRGHLWIEPVAEADAEASARSAQPHAAALCADAVDRTSCLDLSAIAAAQRGDERATMDACMAHSEPQWRQECAFLAAEEMLPVQGYASAMRLCIAAGSYRGGCLDHLLMELSGGRAHPSRPILSDPGQTNRAQFDRARTTAVAIRAAWKARDPSQAHSHADWFWAYWVTRRYLATQTHDLGQLAAVLRGRAPMQVPAELPPHIRAGAAWRVVRYAPQPAKDLVEWCRWVREVVEGRVEDLDLTVDQSDHAKFQGVKPLELAKKVHLPDGAQSVHFGGRSMRLTSTDVATDIAIAVLESAGRGGWAHDTHLDALLEEGLAYPDADVRWTACRLASTRSGLNTGGVPGTTAEPCVEAGTRKRTSPMAHERSPQ
jgi:hypothetical protein